MQYKGIAVSSWQGEIDWPRAKTSDAPQEPNPAFSKGDWARIKSGAKTYDGGGLAMTMRPGSQRWGKDKKSPPAPGGENLNLLLIRGLRGAFPIDPLCAPVPIAFRG